MMSSPPRQPPPRRVYGRPKPVAAHDHSASTTTTTATTSTTHQFGKLADWRKMLEDDDVDDEDDDDDDDDDEVDLDIGLDPANPLDVNSNAETSPKKRALLILRRKREAERHKEDRERAVLLAKVQRAEDGDEDGVEAPSSQNNRGGGFGRERKRVGYGYMYGRGGEAEENGSASEKEKETSDEEESDLNEDRGEGPTASSSLPPLTSSLNPASPATTRPTALEPTTAITNLNRGLFGSSTLSPPSALSPPDRPFPFSSPAPRAGSASGSRSGTQGSSSPSPIKRTRTGTARTRVLRSSSPSGLGVGDDPQPDLDVGMDFEETYAPIKAGVRRPRTDRGGAKKKVVGLDSDDEQSSADEHGRDANLDIGNRTITPSRPHDADGLASEVGESEDVLGSFSTPRKTKRDRSLIIATSGISPESPSRLMCKSNLKANSKRLGGSDEVEDVDEDKDEDDDLEMEGILGSPSVRQSRKRAGRIGQGEVDSEEEGRVAKAPKIRPLSKKQRLEMDREQAKIRAEKPIRLAPSARARPSAPGAMMGGLGMTDFVKATQNAWISARGTTVLGSTKETKPMTQYVKLSSLAPAPARVATTSEVPITSEVPGEMQEDEEIGKFSSGGNRNVGMLTGRLGSSPTNKGKSTIKGKIPLRLRTLDGDDDDEELPELRDVIGRKEQERLIERKREELARQKAIAYKRIQEEKSRQDGDDEDDLVIEGVPDSVKKPPPVKRQNGGTARGIFDHAREARQGKGLDAGQRLAALAGISTKHQDTITESLVFHVGRDFDHANKKRTGALPSGLEKRKVQLIPKIRLEADLLKRQREFNLQERQRKEKASGVKARRLEDRKPLDIEDLIKDGGWEEHADEGASEEDPEDGDYKPEVEADVEMEAVDDGSDAGDDERSIVYSGEEEDEGEPIVRATPFSGNPVEPDDEAEVDLPRRSRPRKTIVHTIRDSDDEEATPKAAAKASCVLPSNSIPDPDLAHAVDPIDFGAFGEDDGTGLGGGFSQFFGATQAGDGQADAFGGFDVLRHDETDAILTTQVHLPDPSITATARRRNEELLEGEMMLDPESMDIEKAEAEKYFNDKGLLTQTRPTGRIPLTKADTSISITSEGASENTSMLSVALSATYRSPPSSTRHAQGSAPNTALDEAAPLRRLKPRRPSSIHSSNDERDITQPSSEAHVGLNSDALTTTDIASDPAPVAQTRPKNAFDVLKASRQNRPKLDPKAMAERKARFVEGEAEESDEENGWGGGNKQDDIEEDEDPDAVLEGLVDDAQKTAEELEREEEQRLQKYREIAEQDDRKSRKMVEDVTKGFYRTGKSGKMGDIDFSDDEDEERKVKRGKKRRKERELKGVDPESAFQQTYEELAASSDEESEDPEDDTAGFSVRLSSPVAEDSVPQKTISDKARQLAIENKRSRDLALLGSASDTEGSDDEQSSFKLERNDSQSFAPRPSLVSRDSAKYARHLEGESQRSTDTRKIGGSSSVSGAVNRRSGSRSSFGAPLVNKTSKAMPPARTQSRTLGRVMDKSGRFDED